MYALTNGLNLSRLTLRNLFVALYLISSGASAASSEHKQIIETIQEFEKRCQQDAWQIWQHSLCGPVLFVHPQTRKVYASHSDKSGLLKQQGHLYVGTLPTEQPIANTATEWAGIRWTMIMLPLSKSMRQRMTLLAHESLHRIQPLINLASQAANNAHLSELRGRYLLLLEMSALSKALSEKDQARNAAILDALSFRRQRYLEFELAEVNEQKLELNEGLAEYTGLVLNEHKDSIVNLVNRIENAKQQASLERTFAYLTGPAYGMLIESISGSRDWVADVNTQFSLSQHLEELLRTKLPKLTKSEIQRLATKYAGNELWISEKQKFEKTIAIKNDYIAKLVKGKSLTLPLRQMQMSFDPNNVTSLEPHGKVYKGITIIDHWGKIEVDAELLMANDFSYAKVNAMDLILNVRNIETIQTSGWKLTINKDWHIVAVDEKLELVKKE